LNFRITRHAEDEMARRGIPHHLIKSVLEEPQQIVPAFGGRKVYQSQIDFGRGKIYLVRVIVDDRMRPPTVITLYRTTRVAKYWRPET